MTKTSVLAPVAGRAVLLSRRPRPGVLGGHGRIRRRHRPAARGDRRGRPGQRQAPETDAACLRRDDPRQCRRSGAPGLDTVALKGEGFTTHVSQGDDVTAGQVVITYDVPFDRGQGAQSHRPRRGHGRTSRRRTSFRPTRSARVRKSPPAQTFSPRTSRWKSSSCRTPRRSASSPPMRSARCSIANPPRCSAWPPDRRRWPIYDELAARCDAGLVSFRQARGFTLDEYVGLPADHPQRYRNVIDTAFVSRVDFAPGAVQGPDGLAADIPAACAAYEDAIRDGGRCRSADPRDRHRRAHRIQRAGVVAGLADPHQDADQTDAHRQRPLLRRRRRIGADALPDPGTGDDHGGPARDLGGDRSWQGRGRSPSRRRPGDARCGPRASCSITRM